MSMLKIFRGLAVLAVLIIVPYIVITLWLTFSKAASIRANIQVDVAQTTGVIKDNWKAVSQGGEEKGRMFEQIVPQISELGPYYIRIDHLTDFYDIVRRDSSGRLAFNWTSMDLTVCDIYAAGAKPFFSLGYMPTVMSEDGTVVGKPKNYDEWALFVQKFIERYSGKSTNLCNGTVQSSDLIDVYYEVWNEPDLESFGKWSLYDGEKDYKTLYFYSVSGADRAQNVQPFNIGGPAITAPYKNWFQVFLKYVKENNLRIDFLSWHRYTADPQVYTQDMHDIDFWLSDPSLIQFKHLPRIISEWGYDSNHNPLEETKLGSAHTVASIKNLLDQNLHLAFAFEVKDGQTPSWGVLTHNGTKKPRFFALKFLNSLDKTRIKVTGEGIFVQAVATKSTEKITVLLVNYDKDDKNAEAVPVQIINIPPGKYSLNIANVYGPTGSSVIEITDGVLDKKIVMSPNLVVSMELRKL